jgi:hypothetical protein
MKTIKQAASEWKRNCSELISIEEAFAAGAAFAQRWISVDDALPEEDTEVLVKCLNGKRIQHDVDFIMNGQFHRRKNVTNWRHIELK